VGPETSAKWLISGQTGPIVVSQVDKGTPTLVVADGEAAVFTDVADAFVAAVQHGERSERGVAVHSGIGVAGERRCRALRDVAGRGRVLVSSVTAAHAESSLPPGYELRDLGIHRLLDLSPPERIFELCRTGASGAPPPLRSLDAVPNNLPVHLTTFVGRTDELDELRSLQSAARLVTIAGAGGCGKTRLAAQAAAAQTERWQDGVWWVDLQGATDPSTVAEAVCVASGVLVDPAGGSLRSLATQLRDRRALICLDNCEHLLEAVAELAETMIRTCPEVSILATSREPLGVPGERVWRLPTLAPAEALELFAERAGQARPGFTVDATNATAVEQLCLGLDGIPLGIELAAAWVRTLTPHQIEAGLDDRFALLVRNSRGAAARHQTLAASIDWSHDLLDERDRAVFRSLGIFVGGFTLDAARAVCARETVTSTDVLSSLTRLVDKSLVIADQRDDATRFRLLETIRQYALDRLAQTGEMSATRGRHLDHLLTIAEAAEPELDRDKDAWCAAIEPERDNLRAALDWGLAAEDPDRGRRLAAATAWLWNLHGRAREGVEILRRAIDRAPDQRTVLQARLLTGFGMLGDTVAPDDIDPVRLGHEIAAELGDDRLRGRCLTLIAVGTFYNDFDVGWQLVEEAGLAAQQTGDQFGVDSARALQGIIVHLRDRHDEAQELLGAAARGLIRRGDRGIAATVLTFQSSSALYTGELVLARQLAAQAAHVAEPLGDYHRVGTARSQLALLQGIGGDIDGGLHLLEGFFHVVEHAGPEVFVPGMARTLGQLLLWRGESERALRWLSPDAPTSGPISDTHLDPMGMPALAEVLRRLGRTAAAAAVLEQAAAIAGRLGMPRVLADVFEQQAHLTGSDDPDRAAALHHEALSLRVEHDLRTFWVDSLDALAALMATTGRAADAARCLAAADQARRALGCARRPVDLPTFDATLELLSSELGSAALDAEWAAGSRLSLDDVVAFVRRTRGHRGRPSTGWASLTPTELEVVRLVAQGLNNPDIGAKLFMSRATVKTHLSHVFTKLGVNNRTELATIAAPRLAEH
jgi:predicted ATPase/DNA-binding CsgD family transcriptional regulator